MTPPLLRWTRWHSPETKSADSSSAARPHGSRQRNHMRIRLLAASAAFAISASGLFAVAPVHATAGTNPVLFGLTDKWKDQILADNNQLNIRAGVVDLFQPWVATSDKRS